MSPPWSKPLEVDRLADQAADVDFDVPLGELAGLRTLRGGVTGQVQGRVHFTREQGLAVAQLELRGAALLQCQRCMGPMELALSQTARVALVHSPEDAARVPEELEPVLAAGGRTSIAELITEELLLTLPIVPLHEADAPCGAPPAQPQPAASETHKPFAQLAQLLQR